MYCADIRYFDKSSSWVSKHTLERIKLLSQRVRNAMLTKKG